MRGKSVGTEVVLGIFSLLLIVIGIVAGAIFLMFLACDQQACFE